LANNNEHDLIQYAIATHSVYLCSEETLRRASELAERRSARLHIHVSETRKEIADCHAKTGLYPVEYLDSIDFFQPGTMCAHASWVKKNEIRLLKEARRYRCALSILQHETGLWRHPFASSIQLRLASTSASAPMALLPRETASTCKARGATCIACPTPRPLGFDNPPTCS